MLDRVEADRPQAECLAHGRMDILVPEYLQQAQHLDVVPLAGLAQAGLEQAAQDRERFGQVPALQRCGLVEGADLPLQQGQVVQRVSKTKSSRA